MRIVKQFEFKDLVFNKQNNRRFAKICELKIGSFMVLIGEEKREFINGGKQYQLVYKKEVDYFYSFDPCKIRNTEKSMLTEAEVIGLLNKLKNY